MGSLEQASKTFSRLAVDHSKHGAKALLVYFGMLAVLIGSVVFTVVALFGDTTTCLGETLQLQLSALDRTPSDRFTQVCELETFQDTLGRDVALAAVYLLGIGVFIAIWWKESWDTEPERNSGLGAAFLALGVVTLLLTAFTNWFTGAMIDISSVSYTLETATAVATLSWIRWLLTGVLVIGLLVTVVAWLVRGVSQIFRLFFDKAESDYYTPNRLSWPSDAPPAPNQFGICLSGGGIRSAAFSLGALSALEETTVDDPKPNSSPGLLGQADLLASVSGGGYAASAWRIAVGPEYGPNSKKPILGDPNNCNAVHSRQRFRLTSEADSPTPMLFARILAHRKYLASGRGGLFVTAVWALLQLLWHMGLLLTAVGLVAWPIGRMIRSPIITSPDGSIQYGRLATPGLLVFGLVALVLLARSFTRPGPNRTASNYALLALAALGTGLLTLLVAIPWLVVILIPELGELLPGGSGATSTAFTILTGGVVATVWRMIQAPLKTYAAYLGGALLLAGLILFGGTVSLHAANDGRLLFGSWTSWFIFVGVYTAVMSMVNPDLWSMHPIYRRRLASTFANQLGASGWTRLESKRAHLPLSHYADAPGPKQVICAVAARTDRANTGVPVVSMTFEPDHVTVHPGPGHESVAIQTAAYEKIFAGRVGARWLNSVMGLASMSGAAVAPSLGRMSMGSTNALIAALNLRLGVWMPNPMYERGRRPSTHMYAMFKEILGIYDLGDPNLYVTDGGHWENLGLVELVRRKTRMIVAVDASADPPHSFASLLEAVELALLECGASVHFADEEMEAMRPTGSNRPKKNWAAADITYDDGSTGRLLYVKAQASRAMPLDILRYSKEDPSFPNYSTANQFLSEAEFVNLAILGRESIIRALSDKTDWLFAPVEVLAEEVAQPEEDAPPDEPTYEVSPEPDRAEPVVESDVAAAEAAESDVMMAEAFPFEEPMMVEEPPMAASVEMASEPDSVSVTVAVESAPAEESYELEKTSFKVKAPPPTRHEALAADGDPNVQAEILEPMEAPK